MKTSKGWHLNVANCDPWGVTESKTSPRQTLELFEAAEEN